MNKLSITVDIPEGKHTSYYDADSIDTIDWQTEIIRIKDLIYSGADLTNFL